MLSIFRINWLWLCLLLCLTFASKASGRIRLFHDNINPQVVNAQQDTTPRRPPGPPTECRYQAGFGFEIPNAQISEIGKLLKQLLDQDRFLIFQDTFKDSVVIRTLHANMDSLLHIPATTIVEMSIKAKIEPRQQSVYLELQFSAGEACSHCTRWRCELSGDIRDKIKEYLRNWQGRFINYKPSQPEPKKKKTG
jgi:hypothetical protein